MSSSNNRIALGKFSKLVDRSLHDRNNILVYSISKHDGFVKSDNYFKKRVYSEDTSKYKVVIPGDFAFSPIHLDEGSIALALEPALISPMYKVFEVDSSICDKNYLIRMLKSPKMIALYGSLGDGSVHRRKSVPFERLSNLEIYLPALDEQRRISAILDKADALRRKRKHTVELLDEVTHSIFLEMFGDPFQIKQVMTHSVNERVPLSQVTSRITYGFTQPVSHQDSGIPILTAKNVRMGSLDLKNVHFTNKQEFDRLSAKSKPDTGDLLVTKDGSIGRAALFDSNLPACINQSIALVKPNRELIRPIYLLYYILSAPVQQQIEGMKKGNAMPHLQISEFSRFPIAVAAMDKQLEFEKRIASVNLQGARNRQSLCEADFLFESLQHRAFSGEL